MASQSVSTFTAALKTLYPSRAIADLTYPINTFFAMVPKSTDFYGENMKVPVHIGDVVGTNSSFSQAQSDKAGTTKKAFFVTRAKEYALASIDNELIEASASNAGAFVAALKSEVDSALKACGRRIGRALYRDGSGAIGVIGSSTNTATTTLVLSNPDDIVNFYVGQSLVFAASNAASLRTATALDIAGIDEDAGSMTLSATPDSLSASIAAGDSIFTKGDYATAGDRNLITGLDGWVPSSAPGATAFFSLDRTAHVTRLGGHRITGTSLQIDEAIYKGCVRVARSGGKTTHVFLSHAQYEVLQNVVGSKVNFCDYKDGAIFFKGIMLNGPSGPVQVYPDYNCPPDVAWCLDLSTWKFWSLNGAPHIVGIDGSNSGNGLLRESSSDAAELRVVAYGNLACWAPGHNARVSLTAPTS